MNMYFVAIVLPAEVDEKVLKYKRYMFDKYGCTVGLKSPAHITLVPPFWMAPENEQHLLDDAARFNHFHSFPLQTNNFSAFKPRTIFIALSPNENLAELKKQVEAFFNAVDYCKIKIENRPFHPHITIATRDLHKKDFAEAWPYFAEKEFGEAWTARGISVLRHNKKNWDVIYTSQFKDL